MGKYKRKKDGVFLDPKTGRMMEHERYATRLYWSKQMLDYLKNNYATTLNDELAGWLGVDKRVVIRKARELCLEKDAEWLRSIKSKNSRLAFYAAKNKGFPGKIEKGEHRSVSTEFKKGHVLSDESKKRHKEAVVAWNKRNPDKVRARIEKARQTRQFRQNTQQF